VHRGAVLAYPDDQGEPQCRFILERESSSGPTAGWLCCNPSRASHLVDDPTNGRVVHHSLRAGCPRSLIGNVWAWRTPYPADLWPAVINGTYSAEMHEANLNALAMIDAQSQVLVVAFGTVRRRYPRFVKAALDAFTNGGRRPLYCLGTTSDGQPLHPLARGKHAVRNDATLRRWPG